MGRQGRALGGARAALVGWEPPGSGRRIGRSSRRERSRCMGASGGRRARAPSTHGPQLQVARGLFPGRSGRRAGRPMKSMRDEAPHASSRGGAVGVQVVQTGPRARSRSVAVSTRAVGIALRETRETLRELGTRRRRRERTGGGSVDPRGITREVTGPVTTENPKEQPRLGRTVGAPTASAGDIMENCLRSRVGVTRRRLLR